MNTPSVEELCDLGDRNLAEKRWDEAEKFYQQALSIDSKSKRALLGQAIVLRTGQYDYEQAQRFLNRCIYHYPGDPDALTEQGRLHAEKEDHPKAVVFFDQAISHDPTKREALQGKILSLIAQGRTADAHQLIESIAPSASRPPWLLRELAQVYIAEGRYDEAVEALLDANEPEALDRTLAEKSDKAASDSLASAIVARLGNNTQALNAVAEVHSSWGDLDAAIEAYTQIVKATPKDENANLQLIDLLRRQGRFDDAEAAYQTHGSLIFRAVCAHRDPAS